MPCKFDPPSVTENEWLEHMLCQACRHLTKEQMMSIKGLDIYYGLLDWYINHLMFDASYYHPKSEHNAHTAHNKPPSMIVISEQERILYNERQLQRCYHEAKRLGLKLIINEECTRIELGQ